MAVDEIKINITKVSNKKRHSIECLFLFKVSALLIQVQHESIVPKEARINT